MITSSNRGSKIDKTDYLLLHISSLLSIIFIFFQILVGGTKALVLFIPLIFLILIIPIYVGYIRGAITLDSNIERVRGWIYLLIGSSYYFLYIGLHLGKEFIQNISLFNLASGAI